MKFIVLLELSYYTRKIRAVLKPGMEWNGTEPIGASADY